MAFLRHILLIAFLLILAGCGYGFPTGETASLPPEYRTLAIDEVEHPTTFSWMEARLRSLLRDELNRRNWVTWTNKSKAKAWIRIVVEKYSRKATVTGSRDETLRASASITLRAFIISPDNGRMLWESGSISTDWPFYGGEEEFADNKVTERAIQMLADRLAQNY